MKVLFIGNSYTYFNDMPQLFEKVARDNGHDVDVYSVTRGGAQLFEYVDTDDEYSKKLNELISQHRFDFCVLQEQSVLPASDTDVFMDGLTRLVSKIGDSVDKFVLYSTWGRKEGSDVLAEYGWTNESMTYALRDAYKAGADRIGADLSDVGVNFLKLRKENSQIELYDPDRSHPSYEGSVLAMLTHYNVIFGELPADTSSIRLPCDVVNALKSVVTN